MLGWRTICAVEWEPYPASVLCARQNDGILPPFPIWDDVQTFDGRPWRGIVDVVSGGFPCQDISAAGKGAGIDGERSGMWSEMARIICEVRPRYVLVENSSMLTSRGLGRVLGDLASMGFDARWGVLGAADVGAPHQRDRIWIAAKCVDNTNISGLEGNNDFKESPKRFQSKSGKRCNQVADTSAFGGQTGLTDSQGWKERDTNKSQHGSLDLANTKDKGNVWREWELGFTQQEHDTGRSSTNGSRQWWSVEPNVGRVADGVAARVDRLKAIGNGQVPLCAATAWRILTER